MLSKILSKSECAKCQICCSFDSYDIWETPVITDEVMQKSLALKKDLKFTFSSGTRQYKMDKEPNEDLYYCSMLDHNKGCLLGDEKPFDCRIWPLRVMRFCGKRVIVLSPVCPEVMKRSVKDVARLAKELAPQIFAEADRTPEMVKPYIKGYVILLAEHEDGKLTC